jgi:hypothetical protein
MSTAEQQKLGTVEFFHGKKASKVLGLVSNIVIDLASRETVDWKMSIELIRMATVIVGTIGDSVKEQWPSSKDSANTQRLLEKATKPGMNNRVVLEVSYCTRCRSIPLIYKLLDLEIRVNPAFPNAVAGSTSCNREFVSHIL